MSAGAYNDEWAANYARRANAAIPGREGLYRTCMAFMRGLPSQANILGGGCGTGDDLVPLAMSLPEASFVGIEPADAMLALCARRVEAEGLSRRVTLRPVTLQNFHPEIPFDAATAILVSQHMRADADAEDFFRQLATALGPRGRLFSADIHIGADQDRGLALALWREQALMSGIEADLVARMANAFTSELRPRDEPVIRAFLESAGFVGILKPFSSLIYGAWAAYKN